MIEPARRADLLRLEVPLGVFGATLVAVAFAFAGVGIPAWIPPAPMARAGVASPLTGMTRSFVATASGDLEAAFRWHPLGPVLFAVCVLAAGVATISWVRGRRIEYLRRLLGRRGLWMGVAAIFSAAWAVKAWGAHGIL